MDLDRKRTHGCNFCPLTIVSFLTSPWTILSSLRFFLQLVPPKVLSSGLGDEVSVKEAFKRQALTSLWDTNLLSEEED